LLREELGFNGLVVTDALDMLGFASAVQLAAKDRCGRWRRARTYC
jgi:beta-glucosidase-like glycosyl hydrolase